MDAALRDNLAANIIARWEGCRLSAYVCPAGYATIGFGHVIRSSSGEMLKEVPAEYPPLSSYIAAKRLLMADLPHYTSVVDCEAPGLSERQSAALVSFVYNLGAGAFRRSTLLRKVKAGAFDEVPDQFARWCYAGGRRLTGLVRRRAAEAALFMEGTDEDG